VEVAAGAVAADRVLAAVEAQVLHPRPQLQQRCAPGAFTAADVEHAAQRPLEMVFGGGHGQRHLARQAPGTADAAAAVPGVEIASVVALGHAAVRVECGRYNTLRPRAPIARAR